MSTEISSPPTQNVSVIVRAFGDEAVPMLVVDRGRGWIEVARRLGGPSIRFPRGLVFAWDDAVLLCIRQACKNGDSVSLSKAWDAAKPYMEI